MSLIKKILLSLVAIFFIGLVPSSAQNQSDRLVNKKNTWRGINYKGNEWVKNVSSPLKIKRGLQNRHISVWSSHGRYYDGKEDKWRWQRPFLFGTTEDLYTQTIVIPYLIPMLQNAGAVVFTPRERDWQRNEVIVDNDVSYSPNYMEYSGGEQWLTTSLRGFSMHSGSYVDGENPFEAGSCRMARTTSGSNISFISYQPSIPEKGEYAVYVSYQTLPNGVDDAEYLVYHKGEITKFRVNQKMGGGTWVYLGTFEFDRGSSQFNRVVVTNNSKSRGVVTADAVRFGGGMGNIERGGKTSNLPRTLEGARYYGQWAGAPYSVYSSKNGNDDYSDDINVRSFMTNWLAGGSVYVPKKQGKGVPIELSLAVHSDAGYAKDGKSLIGSLSICTTNHNNGLLNSGVSRNASLDFATALLNNLQNDLQSTYGKWTIRSVWNKNYSETRVPEVPAAILETLSHQSFPDMRYGQDPNFKFTFARSVYKTILRYISEMHNTKYVVQPLRPTNFCIERTSHDKVTLRWKAQADKLEPTAKPNSYIVYTAVGNSSFDNGTRVKGNSFSVKLEPGKLYHFRVTAANKGGESFPTEVLSASYQPTAQRTLLIINGFNRLSSPAIVENGIEQGFDMDADIGVSYGKTAGWAGRQINFDKSKMGIEDPNGLGFSGDEYVGKFIAGNDFNYVATHARAVFDIRRYNIVSCSREAVESGEVDISRFDCVDLILGLEKNDGHSLRYYKTFTPSMQKIISRYLQRGGRLFVSGAYIGSDMLTGDEQSFLRNWLKTEYSHSQRYAYNTKVVGLNTEMDIINELNEKHYAATSVDVLTPVSPAFCAMQYADGSSSSVAYAGKDYRVFVMGFPFECISAEKERNWVMKGILNYLMQ